MARVEASVVINRPAEEVSAYLNDIRNAPEWQSGLLEAEQTSEGPVGVGTTFRGVLLFLGRRLEWTSELTEYEPNRKWKEKIAAGRLSLEQSLTFEPVEGGTRVTLVGEGEPRGFFRLADPIVVRMMQRDVEGNLARLKDILEAEG